MPGWMSSTGTDLCEALDFGSSTVAGVAPVDAAPYCPSTETSARRPSAVTTHLLATAAVRAASPHIYAHPNQTDNTFHRFTRMAGPQ